MCTKTIYNYIKSGYLKAHRRGPRTIVISIDDIDIHERKTIDVTELASTNEQAMKGIGALGMLNFKIHFDPSDTTHLALQTQHDADADSTIVVTLANAAASTIECVGPLVKLSKKGGGVGDKYIADVSLKINSITRTP